MWAPIRGGRSWFDMSSICIRMTSCWIFKKDPIILSLELNAWNEINTAPFFLFFRWKQLCPSIPALCIPLSGRPEKSVHFCLWKMQCYCQYYLQNVHCTGTIIEHVHQSSWEKGSFWFKLFLPFANKSIRSSLYRRPQMLKCLEYVWILEGQHLHSSHEINLHHDKFFVYISYCHVSSVGC